MIPIARKLRDMDHNVIVGSGDEHLSLFRKEIPGITCIKFPGFKPGYSRFLPQYLSLLFKIPLLLYHIINEHIRLKSLIRKHAVDIVISDNRFGLWNRTITTVYVTHMPLIPLPKHFIFLEPVGVALHRLIIKKFTFCFIPDLPGDLNLSGRLSHGIRLPLNTRYIGILSRFITFEHIKDIKPANSYHDTVILSGPEPQREILKQKLISFLKDSNTHTIVFEGRPGKGEVFREGNFDFYSHLPGHMMKEIIESSRNIITRSGYTTVMELVSLNCTAMIIPTPGQTEQEYLAEYLSEKGWFNTVMQDEIRTGMSLTPGKMRCPQEINSISRILLNEAIKEMLEKSHKQY
jgi:hypothetical protein